MYLFTINAFRYFRFIYIYIYIYIKDLLLDHQYIYSIVIKWCSFKSIVVKVVDFLLVWRIIDNQL